MYLSPDQIDENLRTALQLDLLAMAPGLRVQVRIREFGLKIGDIDNNDIIMIIPIV